MQYFISGCLSARSNDSGDICELSQSSAISVCQKALEIVGNWSSTLAPGIVELTVSVDLGPVSTTVTERTPVKGIERGLPSISSFVGR